MFSEKPIVVAARRLVSCTRFCCLNQQILLSMVENFLQATEIIKHFQRV
jgi:hypothetical protein